MPRKRCGSCKFVGPVGRTVIAVFRHDRRYIAECDWCRNCFKSWAATIEDQSVGIVQNGMDAHLGKYEELRTAIGGITVFE